MYFEDLRTGMTRQIAPVVMEKSKMMAFASQYDPIPLHLDEDYAEASPFGALIAPGMMSFMSANPVTSFHRRGRCVRCSVSAGSLCGKH